MFRRLLILPILLCIVGVVSAQLDDCPPLIYESIDRVNELCFPTARNEVCYGNLAIEVNTREGVQFEAPGDIAPLTSIERITTSPLNLDEQTYGVALMRAQANLPDTIPGQNITFLLLGDVTLTDNAENVTGAAPMQAFLFRPGIGRSGCEGLDYDTLLIESPDNIVVNLNINGVEVALGSTAAIFNEPEIEGIDILVIEGEGIVTANDETVTVPAGMWTQIGLGSEDDGFMAITEPAEPTSFRPERIAHLPFELLQAGQNIALNKPVQASNTQPGDPAERVVDGDTSGNTNWNAGDRRPPQWVEIDLEAASNIAQIRLLTSQYPEQQLDRTVHQIQVAGEDQAFQTVHTFDGETRDNQWLEFSPDAPLLDVRYVRVLTLETIHWVSWGEIEVIGAGFVGCLLTPTQTVNLRAGAGTNFALAGTLEAGTTFRAVARSSAADGFVWWRNAANRWVRDDLVSKSSACERVPQDTP